MPYLPLDLDAKKKAALIGTALGVGPGPVLWGLMELWEHVWRTKQDVVSEFSLDGCFGGTNERLRAALTAEGFVERVETGWRVRGAARWLFAMEGKARGGHAAKANLVPGAGQKAAAASRRREPMMEPMMEPVQECTSSAPSSAESSALTASSQQPTAVKAPAGRAASDVSRNRALSDMLVATYRRLTGSAYGFDGPKDGSAISRLLRLNLPPEEINRRWATAVVDGCPGIAAFAAQFNKAKYARATDPPPVAKPAPKRPVMNSEQLRALYPDFAPKAS